MIEGFESDTAARPDAQAVSSRLTLRGKLTYTPGVLNVNIEPEADTSARRAYTSEAGDVRAGDEHDPRFDDARDPRWNVGAAIVVWVASVLAIIVVPLLALAIYYLTRSGVTAETLAAAGLGSDPNALLVGIAATLPAHLLTFVIVWMVASGAGRRPFWRSISWGKLDLLSAALWTAAAAATWLAVQAVVGVIVRYTGAGDTAIDVLIKSSPEARIVIAALAVLSAPIVEELVYRGVLYPALRRALGIGWAISIVAGLFAAVHFQQYEANPGLIVGVTLLSVVLTIVRERTNSLAPCFVMHFVFNFITAVLLLLYPSIEENLPKPPPALVTYAAASPARP